MGVFCLGFALSGGSVQAGASRLSDFAAILKDQNLEGVAGDGNGRLPNEEASAAGLPADTGKREEETDRLSGFAALLKDRSLEGVSSGETKRLPEEEDERLSDFAAQIGSLDGGTRTITGGTSDKRLLGFAQQLAETDSAYTRRYGAHKEDKIVLVNAPAGALESSTDTVKTEQDLPGQPVLSSEERVILAVLLNLMGNEGAFQTENGEAADPETIEEIRHESPWASSLLKTTDWTEETWEELFPTDDMTEDSRKLINIGDYRLTAYCPCELCTGKTDGITKSGVRAVQGRTVAVDPTLLSLGSQLVINGHVFTAEDTGGAIKGTHIDIYMDSHEQAMAFGTQRADVYLLWEPKKQSTR